MFESIKNALKNKRLTAIGDTDFPALNSEKLSEIQQLAIQNEEALSAPTDFYATAANKFVEDTPQNRFLQPLQDVADDFARSMEQSSRPANPDVFSALSNAYRQRLYAIQTTCPQPQQEAFTALLEDGYRQCLQTIGDIVFDAFRCALSIFKTSGKIALDSPKDSIPHALQNQIDSLNSLAGDLAETVQAFGTNARAYVRRELFDMEDAPQTERPFEFNDSISSDAPLDFASFASLLTLTKQLSFTIVDINAYVQAVIEAVYHLPVEEAQAPLSAIALTKLTFSPSDYSAPVEWLNNYLSGLLEEEIHIYLPPARQESPDPAAEPEETEDNSSTGEDHALPTETDDDHQLAQHLDLSSAEAARQEDESKEHQQTPASPEASYPTPQNPSYPPSSAPPEAFAETPPQSTPDYTGYAKPLPQTSDFSALSPIELIKASTGGSPNGTLAPTAKKQRKPLPSKPSAPPATAAAAYSANRNDRAKTVNLSQLATNRPTVPTAPPKPRETSGKSTSRINFAVDDSFDAPTPQPQPQPPSPKGRNFDFTVNDTPPQN